MIAKLKAQPFQSTLVGYSAKHIAAVIGCSTATAYDWRSGRRKPTKWIERLVVKELHPPAVIALFEAPPTSHNFKAND